MFEQLPEKPPHLAGKWLVMIGGLGAGVGVGVAGWLFGEEAMQSNVVLFGSAALGIVAGVAAGWKLIMPSHQGPAEPLD